MYTNLYMNLLRTKQQVSLVRLVQLVLLVPLVIIILLLLLVGVVEGSSSETLLKVRGAVLKLAQLNPLPVKNFPAL